MLIDIYEKSNYNISAVSNSNDDVAITDLFLEKYITKSKYHIAIGDHEDLQKDLKKKHRK